jgi:uncharacterized protein (DUF433 family)
MHRKTSMLRVRLPVRTRQIIREISASSGRTAGDLLADYAEEIARKHQFCYLEFRDTPIGRMAYIKGTRSAVWLICELVKQNEGDVTKIAKLHGWPETKVRAAMNYATANPKEIEGLRNRARTITQEKLRKLNAA